MADPETQEEERLLDITTLTARPKILIDGELYELVAPDELTILDHHRLRAWGRRHDALMAKDRLTKAERTELPDLIARISDLIMIGVPDSIRAKLTDSHRLEIIDVFTRLPQRRAANALLAATLDAIAAGSTGASRSPASNGSMAATPDGGSMAAPAGSSSPI